MSSSNYIERVAIIGATGRVGGAIAEALLATGKHTVTAITRDGSTAEAPAGAKVVKVPDYGDEAALVSALKGQQFLVIALGVAAPGDLHSKIVAAGAKAGVPYMMPNCFGTDLENEGLRRDESWARAAHARAQEVKDAGSAYIVMVCGFWYQWSLGTGEQWFGFDIKNRKVTFYDDGKTRINSSTWPQCGRAVAALLSLPISGASPCVEDWRNKQLCFDSFMVSQRDMLDSLNRVLGTGDKDWTIKHETSAQRYKDGLAELERGDWKGRAKAMYARVFYPDGSGDYGVKGLANEALGLQKEDLDQATKETVDMVMGGWDPLAPFSQPQQYKAAD